MQLLRLSEVEKSSAYRVFRYSLARMALLFVGVVCLGTTLLLIHWEGRLEPLHYIAYYIFAVLLLGLALLRKFLFARFRPSNWLVRMHHANLLIQFRSLPQLFPARRGPHRSLNSLSEYSVGAPGPRTQQNSSPGRRYRTDASHGRA